MIPTPSKMKVLLINPPAESPYPVLPLGLAYLASYLEDEDHGVAVIDAWAENLSTGEIVDRVKKFYPGAVGVTITTPLFDRAMEIISAIKEKIDVPIIVGGPHPSALPVETLKSNQSIDFAIIGEGEKPLAALLEALENDENYTGISGLVYRAGDKIVTNFPDGNYLDLEDISIPGRYLFPMENYNTHIPYGRKRPYLTLITSRGCPYKCKYCSKSVFGAGYRAMSPERVADEVEYLVEEHGAKELHFYDDVFTMNRKRTETICDEIISREIKVDWSCTTRVDLVDKELLTKMKKAGCWLISYGVESGSEELLKNINKNYTLGKVRETFQLTHKAGIRTLGFFMIGLPGETEETIGETIKLSLEIDPDFVSWSIMTLMPGSIYYKELMGNQAPVYSNICENECIHKFAVSSGYNIYEGAMSKEKLLRYTHKPHERYYLPPSYILKSFLKFRTFHEISEFSKNGFQFVLDTLTRKL